MSDKISADGTLYETVAGYAHWCSGCGEAHVVPKSWTFNGNFSAPTFSPSVKLTGKQRDIVDGQWTGEWRYNENGDIIDWCCHYFIRNGQIEFCGDCTHEMRGQKMALQPFARELI